MTTLVPWAEELKLRYISGESSIFLLHGNVRDLFSAKVDEKVNYIDIQKYLNQFLGKTKDTILYYNISDGASFNNSELGTENLKRKRLLGLESIGSDPTHVLKAAERMILKEDSNTAVIIDYLETITPMADISFMEQSEKANLVRLQRWTSNTKLLERDSLVILITENLSQIHKRLLSCPQLATIEMKLPNSEQRRAFVEHKKTEAVQFSKDMSINAFADFCAGLSLIQISAIMRRAEQSQTPIEFSVVSQRKKAIIEQECHGLVEFVAPKHNFTHVGGMAPLKDELNRVAKAIKEGRRNQVPMGMLFVGPMGTGKTYIAEAFAGESGLTCLKFKNFREKWVGSTEGNLEKILQVVNGLGYVLLIIDEADRSMNSNTGSDGGTSSRVIARIKEFMSDTKHRGRVVVLMMTNRPDKIDIDLKRPGRLDYKIPFFFPQDQETREAILSALIRKNKIKIVEGTNVEVIAPQTKGYSAAELEAVLLRSLNVASGADREEINEEDLIQAATDVIPSRDTKMLEYMEMLAVFESSSREMLPEKYQDIETSEVHSRLEELRMELGIHLRS
jgi:SpoVK/Ycf46/Vps4 family AAA+-type ATPase